MNLLLPAKKATIASIAYKFHETIVPILAANGGGSLAASSAKAKGETGAGRPGAEENDGCPIFLLGVLAAKAAGHGYIEQRYYDVSECIVPRHSNDSSVWFHDQTLNVPI